jgi:hypothetical protein
MKRGPNEVEQVRELFAPGTVLGCVEDSYIPAQAGSRRRVGRLGRAFAEVEMLGEKGRRTRYRMVVPRRARDVLSIDGDGATYPIGDSPERLRGQTLTVRRVAAPREGRL